MKNDRVVVDLIASDVEGELYVWIWLIPGCEIDEPKLLLVNCVIDEPIFHNIIVEFIFKQVKFSIEGVKPSIIAEVGIFWLEMIWNL